MSDTPAFDEELRLGHLIREAELSADAEMVVSAVCTSLRYLRKLSKMLGKPIDEITYEEIIARLKNAIGPPES